MVGVATNVCGNTLINSELLRYKKCVRFQTVNRSQRTGSDTAGRRGPRCFDGFNICIFNGPVGLIWLKRYSFCVRIGLLFAW